MMEILKNLAQHELTTVLIVLGLIKEVRKLIQVILNYKIQKNETYFKKSGWSGLTASPWLSISS